MSTVSRTWNKATGWIRRTVSRNDDCITATATAAATAAVSGTPIGPAVAGAILASATDPLKGGTMVNTIPTVPIPTPAQIGWKRAGWVFLWSGLGSAVVYLTPFAPAFIAMLPDWAQKAAGPTIVVALSAGLAGLTRWLNEKKRQAETE